MAVMVTGGKGVIGAFVARQLLAEGDKVVIYDLDPDNSLISDIASKVELLRGDILDLPAIMRALKKNGVDCIVHAAALMPAACYANPYLAYKINGEGTINIFEAAALLGLRRVVFMSTRGVYAPLVGEYGHPTYKPITEDYPKDPDGIYPSLKLFCEYMAANYRKIYGIDIITLRFAQPYGPGRLARHRAISNDSFLTESAASGKPARIETAGDQKDDRIYVIDIASAVVKACYAHGLDHNVFHIGSGAVTSMKDVVKAIKRIIPSAKVGVGSGMAEKIVELHPRYGLFDISRAKRELGYEPAYDLERGIAHFIEMLRKLDLKLKE